MTPVNGIEPAPISEYSLVSERTADLTQGYVNVRLSLNAR